MAKIILSFKKSFLEREGLTKEGMERCLAILGFELRKAFSPGTIRVWKGKKFIKGADKKWRPYFEKVDKKKVAVKENLKKPELKGVLTKEESGVMRKLRSLLPTSDHGWVEHWISNKGLNDINFEVGSIDKKGSLKGIIKNNINCSEKRLLAITAVITDAILYGKCTEEKEGEHWCYRPTTDKKFEKNGIIISTNQIYADSHGEITNIDTETNKEAFEKAVKDFEAKIDENGEFEGQSKKEKWSDYLGYMKKAKRMVKANMERKLDTIDLDEIPDEVPENFKEITVKDVKSGKITKYVKGDNSEFKQLVYDRHGDSQLLGDLKIPQYYEILTIDMGEGKKRVVRKYKELELELEAWDKSPYINDPNPKTMEQALREKGVIYNPVKKLKKIPTDEKIINNLTNYDGTGGSCASLALCYAAQKMGYDVTDFRGGWSRKLFSTYARDVNQYLFAEYYKFAETDSEEAALKLLKQVREGENNKQYLLSTGHHCAVVRKKYDGELQYLELQAGDEYKGWQYFDDTPKEKRDNSTVDENGFSEDFKKGLRKRFGITKGRADSALFSINAGLKPEKRNDFLRLMGYINSKGGPQRTLTRQEWIDKWEKRKQEEKQDV